jgi:hypothetical protein
MYGFGGHHHRRVDSRYWMNRIWNLEYQGSGVRPEIVREEIERRAGRMPSSVAVEICPRFKAAVIRRISEEKAKKANEHARHDPEAYF